MDMKLIRSDAEYKSAINRVEQLIDRGVRAGSEDSDELEMLALLIQNHESKAFPLEPTDPVDAIEFRMDQMGMTARDLIPYIGSRSKVYDVLSRKRPLSLPMIRSLSAGLGIPLESLVAQGKLNEEAELDFSKFPITEMVKRGYWNITLREARKNAEALLKENFALVGVPLNAITILTKRTTYVREGRTMDRYSLFAWAVQVLKKAKMAPPIGKYRAGVVSHDLMRQIAEMSRLQDGPLSAIKFLRENGIAVIVLRHLPKTYLDGAAILDRESVPVIGLTRRYDRIDNFWFSLEHELAHIALHLNSTTRAFFDNLETKNDVDPREQEADAFAGEALIPNNLWKQVPASSWPTRDSVIRSAEILKVDPAVVAGRIRHEQSFRILKEMVGHGRLSEFFPDA